MKKQLVAFGLKERFLEVVLLKEEGIRGVIEQKLEVVHEPVLDVHELGLELLVQNGVLLDQQVTALLFHPLEHFFGLFFLVHNVFLHPLINLELLDDVQGLRVFVVPDPNGFINPMFLDEVAQSAHLFPHVFCKIEIMKLS